MNKEEINKEIERIWVIDKIKEICSYSIGDKSISIGSRLILDLYIDSLEMLELIHEIERYTEKQIDNSIWMQWNQIGDIVDYLLTIKMNH